MRTIVERIEQMHRLAGELGRRRERRQLAGLASLSVLLTGLLLIVMAQACAVPHAIAGAQFAGSSLLGESAGGYVLAAVLAFFAGVIITALIYRFRRK